VNVQSQIIGIKSAHERRRDFSCAIGMTAGSKDTARQYAL